MVSSPQSSARRPKEDGRTLLKLKFLIYFMNLKNLENFENPQTERKVYRNIKYEEKHSLEHLLQHTSTSTRNTKNVPEGIVYLVYLFAAGKQNFSAKGATLMCFYILRLFEVWAAARQALKECLCYDWFQSSLRIQTFCTWSSGSLWVALPNRTAPV